MVMRRGWRGRGRRREYRWFRLRNRGPELRRDLPGTEGFPEAVGRAGIEGSEDDAGAGEGGLEDGVEVQGEGVANDGDAGALGVDAALGVFEKARAREGHGGGQVAVAAVRKKEQEIAGTVVGDVAGAIGVDGGVDEKPGSLDVGGVGRVEEGGG